MMGFIVVSTLISLYSYDGVINLFISVDMILALLMISDMNIISDRNLVGKWYQCGDKHLKQINTHFICAQVKDIQNLNQDEGAPVE